MPVGNWTHVAGTLDDATGLLRLYTNGVVAAETNTTVRPLGPLNPAYHPGVGIGNHSSQPGPFNYAFRGLIDELSVYNRALSASEIQGIYGADSGGKCFHTPPIAADMTAATYKNQAMSIPIPKLLLFASDPDGDPLSLASVSANSTNGGGVVVSGNVVTYTPVPGFIGADRFTWTVSDGDSTASAFVLIQVRNSDGISQNMLPLTATANGYRVSFAGIPGRSYTIQRAPSVTGPWTTLTTVTAGPDGIGSYEDTNPLPGSAFYRTVYP
jgi:hypothetical protein